MITKHDPVISDLGRYHKKLDKTEAEEQALEKFIEERDFEQMLTDDQISDVLCEVWDGKEGEALKVMRSGVREAFEREKKRDDEVAIEAQSERLFGCRINGC